MWQQLANNRIMIKLKSLEIRGALAMPVKPEETRIIARVPPGRTQVTTIMTNTIGKNLHEQIVNN